MDLTQKPTGGDSAPPEDLVARSARIRLLNDLLREGFPTGQVVLTRGVASLPEALRILLMLAVQHYADFSPASDPFDEHDFGAVEFADERYFWKIDYYDNDLNYGSPDPTDPDVTRRVLIIMRANEY
ncbi:MAG: DUF3768 domain-containing protein [Rhizobiaceae bacterium]